MSGQDQNSDQQRSAAGGETPLAEWLVAVVGFLLVAASIAFLLYQALAVEAPPPEMTMMVEETSETGQGFLVVVSVHNKGGKTVSGLTVEGELKSDDGVVETSTTTLDYVAAHSTRQVGFFFSENPNDYELTLRAGGYQSP